MTRLTIENYDGEHGWLGETELVGHSFREEIYLFEPGRAISGDPLPVAFRVVSEDLTMGTACADEIKRDRELLDGLQRSYLESLTEGGDS